LDPTTKNNTVEISSFNFFDELNQAVLVLDNEGVIVWKSQLLLKEFSDDHFALMSPFENYLNTKEQLTLQHMLAGDKSAKTIEVRKVGAFFRRYENLDSQFLILYQFGGKSDAKAWNKDQLQLAVSTSEIGLWDWDVKNNILTWDESMYELYEINRADFTGAYDAWESTLHHDDIENAVKNLERSLAGEIDFDTIFRIITPRGKIKHIRASAVIYRDENGAAEQMVGINYDITAKQNRLNRLKSNQFLLNTLFSKAPVGICIFDLNGKFLEINPAFTGITGYTIKELNSIGYWDLTPIEFKEEEKEQSDILHETGSYGPYQKEYIHKKGYSVPVLLNGVLITDDATNEKLIWSVVQDLSAQQNTLDELSRSNEDLNEFAYVASHDLREPLRIMDSYIRLVQERYGQNLDEKGKQFIDRILDASERMNNVILSLLDYSRVDRKALELEEIDLEELVCGVEDDLELMLSEAEGVIERKVNGPIYGERSQLYRVFQNIISNSVKYRHQDRPLKIKVCSKSYKDYVQITICDNGIGIDPSQSERIFKLFQRLHTRNEYPGTGIGLSIVKKIVERHHGQIWAESNETGGLTIHFTIR